jgi:alkylation response protein AidB-like acyl-CoA dehydrogenase
MTTTIEAPSTATSLADLRAEFAPLFATINEGVAERERSHTLPYEQVRALKDAGFTSLRVPREYGGRGVELDDFLELLVDLAAADSNVAHLLRGHIAHVEFVLLKEESERRALWLRRFGGGDIVGNAASERNELTEITTVLDETPYGPTVTGTKYYTTGSIFSDWVSLSAKRGEERVSVLVRADHPGVTITDDWDGFGQQLTGSGSLTVQDVPVDPEDVSAFSGDDAHGGFRVGLFQTILLGVAAGIARAAVQDAVEFVKPRRRTFNALGESRPAEDPAVQTVIGEADAKAFAAASIVAQVGGKLARYADARGVGLSSDELAVDVYKAQQVVLKLVTDTATEIFEVGGASATSTTRRLDRHWRNARTVASHNPAKYRATQLGRRLLTGDFQLYRK